MVLSYYTADFSDLSIAVDAQRLSRKRHLPKVLADLRERVGDWTEWES